MVTFPENEPLFEPLLCCLEDQKSPCEDRVDCYLSLAAYLREENDDFVKEVCGSLKRLVVVLKNDILSQKIDLSQAGLQSLGFCLFQEQIVRSFTTKEIKELIRVLCQTLESTHEKGVCTRALWCIAKQNVSPVVMSSELDRVLVAVESALKRNVQSTTVEHEALCVVERFLAQLPEEDLRKRVEQWSKLVWCLLVSSAPKVRDKALATFNSGLNQMVKSREKLQTRFLQDLKSYLVAELIKLFSMKKEVYVLKVWMCIVPVLGKALHKGGDLINSMLKIVEQGFKSHTIEIQVLSYSAWNVLIDNFSSQDCLCNERRLKLIMTPLINSAVKERNDIVESARLLTWWHLTCALGSRLPDMFEQVCVPLLQFLFGTCGESGSLIKNKEEFGVLKCPPTPTNNKLMTEQLVKTPMSSVRRSLKDVGTPKTPSIISANFAHSEKKELLIQGCEVLCQLLWNGETSLSDCCTRLEEHLAHVVFKEPSVFRKHVTQLINVTRKAIAFCGFDLSESLVCELWKALLGHVGNLAKEDQRQRSDHENVILPLLELMEEIVEKQFLPPATCLKMLESFSKLPPCFLNCHTSCLQSKTNPDGAVGVQLVQLRFHRQLLPNNGDSERLHLAFENVLKTGMDSTSGQLMFAQAILHILDSRASELPKKETVWRLWSSVVTFLSEYIVKSNDVNQGNALQHNFSAVYAALTFPVKHIMPEEHLSLGISNAATSELYKCFSRESALVSTAEVNTGAEELSALLLLLWDEQNAKKITYLDGLVSLVRTVTNCLDFSPTSESGVITSGWKKSQSTITSVNWSKPLGNLTSLVQLMAKLLTACHDYSLKKVEVQSVCVVGAVTTALIECVSFLFCHITGTVIISGVLKTLARPLVQIIANAHLSVAKGVQHAGNKKMYTNTFIQKVEKLWSNVLTCIQSRHGGPYDSEFLAVLSPLMEVTFCHPRRFFRNHVIMFWNATFAHAQTLDYPKNIRKVLQTTKTKVSIVLPGWDLIKHTFEETTLDIQPEEDSQEANFVKHPPPHIILASPQKGKSLTSSSASPQQMKGSFLHKAAEIAVNNLSPVKQMSDSPLNGNRRRSVAAGTHARRKLPLSLNDDNDDEYVFIAPSPKKKSRLLTEHQKEVMQSRSVIPALYSVLDQSQDPFNSFTSQESSQDSINIHATLFSKKENEVDPIEAELTKVGIENRDASKKPTTLDKGIEVALSEMKDADIDASLNNYAAVETDFSSTIQETGSEKNEPHSPDVIPSSQTSSSSECSFQLRALRRVSVPVEDVILKTSCSPMENLSKDLEMSGVKHDECCVVQDKCLNDPHVLDQVSPIAGRTRRKSLGKVDNKKAKGGKSDKRNKCAEEKSCQSKMQKEEVKDLKMKDSCSLPEKPSSETVSSPVPASRIKFVRPLFGGGSPVQHRISRGLSPVASPTTSILKRTSASCRGQTVDSPSPPGKVRRVSFALPVEKEMNLEKEWEEQIEDREESVGAIPVDDERTSTSGSFTVIKQRHFAAVTAKQEPHPDLNSKECVFPELVDCPLPVEQILPSLAASSWSRGLSHVVHAQNIRTIGNLSSLKEQQVKNLPIKSPKIDTLRHVLRTFHTNQKARVVKSSHKTSTMPTITETSEEKSSDVDNSISFEKETKCSVSTLKGNADQVLQSGVSSVQTAPDSTTNHESLCSEPSRQVTVEKDALDTSADKPDAVISSSSSSELEAVSPSNDLQVELLLSNTNNDQLVKTFENNGKAAVRDNGTGYQVESFTPPLPVTKDLLDDVEQEEVETPKRCTHAKRTVLFDSTEQDLQELCDQEIIEIDEDSVDVRAEHGPDVVGQAKENVVGQKSCATDEIALKSSNCSNPCTSDPHEKDLTNFQGDSLYKNLKVTENETSNDSGKDFCKKLNSLVPLATADVLSGLSSSEIFECHQDLTRLMAGVVHVLKERCKSPK